MQFFFLSASVVLVFPRVFSGGVRGGGHLGIIMHGYE